jgi:hypothetical protein
VIRWAAGTSLQVSRSRPAASPWGECEKRAELLEQVAAGTTLANGHEVHEAQPAAEAGEGHLENVGAGQIGQRGAGGTSRPQAEVAATVGVEQAAEDGGAVEMGQAEPVYRAVGADKCGSAAVADDAVLSDGPVARGLAGRTGFDDVRRSSLGLSPRANWDCTMRLQGVHAPVAGRSPPHSSLYSNFRARCTVAGACGFTFYSGPGSSPTSLQWAGPWPRRYSAEGRGSQSRRAGIRTKWEHAIICAMEQSSRRIAEAGVGVESEGLSCLCV